MKIITVTKLNFCEKDLICVETLKDFEEVVSRIFDKKELVYRLENTLYVIGSEVVYAHELQEEQH